MEEKLSEIEALSSQLQQPSSRVDDFEGQVVGVHIDIRKLQLEKEKILRRLSSFRESIALKLSTIERQLEECVKAKDTYSNFMYFDLNAIEITSYALYAMLTTTKVTKDTWEKGMNSLKENFDDCMKIIAT